MRMDELKPCPFCGGTGIWIEQYDCTAGKRWRIMCLKCGAGFDPGWVQERYMIVEMWNRRVTS